MLLEDGRPKAARRAGGRRARGATAPARREVRSRGGGEVRRRRAASRAAGEPAVACGRPARQRRGRDRRPGVWASGDGEARAGARRRLAGWAARLATVRCAGRRPGWRGDGAVGACVDWRRLATRGRGGWDGKGREVRR
ncbi:Os08g0274150 [Oryza sativa Japonica Group]|uniref:Os08g0274150 protein n=1 Tax=Oryza sativa subsp. japonica TaxID=39947 RepID=A0A0P0XDS8_ORYSJ|nr:Os08g0274150 [Oryza sativa Japonica Group]